MYDPMNPAPPVTSTRMAATLGGPAAGRAVRHARVTGP